MAIKTNPSLVRCAGHVPQGRLPVHPASLGDVPGERGAPSRHVQLLHKLPRVLLRVQPVQGSTVESGQNKKVLFNFL